MFVSFPKLSVSECLNKIMYQKKQPSILKMFTRAEKDKLIEAVKVAINLVTSTAEFNRHNNREWRVYINLVVGHTQQAYLQHLIRLPKIKSISRQIAENTGADQEMIETDLLFLLQRYWRKPSELFNL